MKQSFPDISTGQEFFKIKSIGNRSFPGGASGKGLAQQCGR